MIKKQVANRSLYQRFAQFATYRVFDSEDGAIRLCQNVSQLIPDVIP
jgi:hypothetical protein